MTMKKIFNDNSGYFKWFNKNQNKIKIHYLAVKDVIIVTYEKKADLC